MISHILIIAAGATLLTVLIDQSMGKKTEFSLQLFLEFVVVVVILEWLFP